jgi:hypothetical protein
MLSNSLFGLTSISQWALFMGIALILFGWIEKKEKFVLSGQLTFLLLGFLALYVWLTDGIIVPPNDGVHIPKELKVLIFFKWIALFTGLNLVSILLKQFNLRFQKISLYLLVIFALMLFFMVFSIQQMAN